MSPAMICALLVLWFYAIDCQIVENAPRCETCKYTPGHHYLNHSFCGTYFKCLWDREDPLHFTHELHCCDENQVFDDTRYPPGCSFPIRGRECTSRRFFRCPPPALSLCPFRPNRRNPTQYLVEVFGDVFEVDCGEGTIYDHGICGCTHPKAESGGCERLLDFDFDANIQSTVCDQFVIGMIFGDAFMATGVICFSGYEQFFEISYLMEWFSESEKKEFTVSFFFNSADGFRHKSGLFSSNCLWRTYGSPVELFIEHDELVAVLGHHPDPKKTGQYIDAGRWYHVAVTYLEGLYNVYLNGEMVYEYIDEGPLARSTTHATLGYVERDMFFSGCMDDFIFYTVALDQEQIDDTHMNRTRFY